MTLPLRNATPVAPKASAGADDGARVAGVLHAVEHHHQGLPRTKLVQRPGGRAHQRDHALAESRSKPGCAKTASLTATTRVRLSPAHVGGYGGQHIASAAITTRNLAAAAQGFFEQMEAFGHREPVRGERPARAAARRTSLSSGFLSLSRVSVIRRTATMILNAQHNA